MAPARALRPQPLIIGAAIVLLLAAIWFGQRTKLAGTRDGFSIVCTFLPVYVFTLNVVGDTPGVDVELLMPGDSGCPHDYAVRSQDLKRVANADVIVANGLGIDQFVQSLTRNSTRARVIEISDDCELIESEQCTHTDHAHHHHHHEHVNGHVWVSPVQAIRQVHTLANKLAEADFKRAEQYQANAKAYIARLEALKTRMQKSAEQFEQRNIVTLHDSFAYLARDLNLNVVGTLTLDPEHAPSAKQMTDTIDAIKRERVAAIFHEPAYSDRLAKSISSDSGVPMYSLNPMTSVEGPITARAYEEVMEQNLAVLEQALGKKQ